MSSITTAERWIRMPLPAASSGTAARFRLDQPGGAGSLQVASSNATQACREGGLRTLWELGLFTEITASTTAAGQFNWAGLDVDGGFVRFCGVHRIRPWSENDTLQPRIVMRCRGAAPPTFTLGVILALTAPGASPDAPGTLSVTTSTTSTSVTDLEIVLPVGSSRYNVSMLEQAVINPTTGLVRERGTAPAVALWLGAWCEPAGAMAAKGALFGVTIFLRPASPNV